MICFRMKYHGKGKIRIISANEKWIEGQMEWAQVLGCDKDDAELILNLFIVWRHIPWNKITDKELWSTVQIRLDQLSLSWLNLDSNFCDLPNVHHNSIYLLAAIITRIWNDGCNIVTMRKYMSVLTKAASDLELISPHGFKKMVQVRVTLTRRTIRDGFLLRKLPTPIYVAHVYCLTRNQASVNDMKEFLSYKKQGTELVKDCIGTTLL